MRIGYYAHHHGSGHCRQADKLAGLLPLLYQTDDLDRRPDTNSFTVFTSVTADDYPFKNLAEDQIVRLPDEHETSDDVLLGRAGEYWQPKCLHYSPVGNQNIQARSTTLLNEIAKRKIDIMIIDLSVEVALLCRTASIAYLYVRLPGDRDDSPHLNAFAGALGLIAMYPKVLESDTTPEWVAQKTLHLGFLVQDSIDETTSIIDSKSDLLVQLTDYLSHPHCTSANTLDTLSIKNNLKPNQENSKLNKLNSLNSLNQAQPIITVIKGYGGHKVIDAKLTALREAYPNALIISLGPITDEATNVVDVALEVNDVSPFLAHSDVVIMACGLNSVAEVCQFDTPLVVLPDDRPHQEQQRMAEALIACGRGLAFTEFLALGNNNLIRKSERFGLNKDLITQLQTSTSKAFMRSVMNAPNTKMWFYDWLLPQLGSGSIEHSNIRTADS